MDLNIVRADQCLPLSRGELFAEIVDKRVYGEISQVWQFPGHILVTADEGKKLFTIDCKPISHQHAFQDKCLDISNLSSPLADALMIFMDVFALIDTNGHMNIWRFTQNFTWSHTGSLQICTSEDVEILSVTYILGCKSLFWCEKRTPSLDTTSSPSSAPTYCICRKQITTDADHGKIKEQTSSSVLIHNCPPCDVLAMSSDVLFVTTQYHSEQVMMTLVLDFARDQLSLYIGDECVDFPLPSDKALDFPDIVMTCLEVLMKTEPGQGDLGVKSDITQKQIAVLSSSGQVEVYSCISESGKSSISRKCLKFSSGMNQISNQRHWFLHQGHLGILCNGTVCIFSLLDGHKVCESHLEAVKGNQTLVFPSTSPAYLAWILTSNNLLALQGLERKSKEIYTSPEKLPDDHLLQTEALRLAHLQELRVNGFSQKVIEELEGLKKNWEDTKNLPQHSQISNILAPYVEEYWRLESISKVLLDSGKPLVASDTNSAETMVRTIMERRSLSKTARHSKLVWLSQVHPQELLDYLCQGINIDCDNVLQSEMKKWQLLLGLDGGDYMNFEFVCRLLFQLQPSKLLNFARCAEFVCERTVGVSAFVRKKHSLIYYKTACECLPESHLSCDPKTAASVKAKLILASESDNCVERALKYLLQHELWSEAVELMKSQTGNEEKLPAYLHVTVTALAQGHVLSDYVADLFAIMPSWKSFISFSRVAAEQPELRHQQLSTSAKDVFAQGPPDVTLGSVKQSLIDLVKKMDGQQ